MNQYLLSTYTVVGEVPGAPGTPEEMQEFMRRVDCPGSRDGRRRYVCLRRRTPRTRQATVMSPGGNVMTDGPFAGSKEQIAGFYIINADTLDEAQAWAGKVAEATNHPIEVRAFRATGRVAEHMPGA